LNSIKNNIYEKRGEGGRGYGQLEFVPQSSPKRRAIDSTTGHTTLPRQAPRNRRSPLHGPRRRHNRRRRHRRRLQRLALLRSPRRRALHPHRRPHQYPGRLRPPRNARRISPPPRRRRNHRPRRHPARLRHRVPLPGRHGRHHSQRRKNRRRQHSSRWHVNPRAHRNPPQQPSSRSPRQSKAPPNRHRPIRHRRLRPALRRIQKHLPRGTSFVSDATAKKEDRRKFQAIRGTRDLLPPETALWNRVEQTAHEAFSPFGYGEIPLPIFELTELFARAVGGETDVVAKEMYSFIDRAVPDIDRASGEVFYTEVLFAKG